MLPHMLAIASVSESEHAPFYPKWTFYYYKSAKPETFSEEAKHNFRPSRSSSTLAIMSKFS